MSTVDAIDTHNVTLSIADALRKTYGNAKAAAKQIARTAGSNTRAAENWLQARNAPTAKHLIHLMAESDEVFNAVMKMSGRHTEAEKNDLLRRLQEIQNLVSRNASS